MPQLRHPLTERTPTMQTLQIITLVFLLAEAVALAYALQPARRWPIYWSGAAAIALTAALAWGTPWLTTLIGLPVLPRTVIPSQAVIVAGIASYAASRRTGLGAPHPSAPRP